IPRFNVLRSKRHTLRIGQKALLDGHERCAHLRSLVDWRLRRKVKHTSLGIYRTGASESRTNDLPPFHVGRANAALETGVRHRGRRDRGSHRLASRVWCDVLVYPYAALVPKAFGQPFDFGHRTLDI